jgi:hypothetical protein
MIAGAKASHRHLPEQPQMRLSALRVSPPAKLLNRPPISRTRDRICECHVDAGRLRERANKENHAAGVSGSATTFPSAKVAVPDAIKKENELREAAGSRYPAPVKWASGAFGRLTFVPGGTTWA